MNLYIQNTLREVHDRIQDCPVDSPATEKILIILEKLNMAVQTLAAEALKEGQ